MEPDPEPLVGSTWRSHLGVLYRVVALSRDHDTKEVLVTYTSFISGPGSVDTTWTMSQVQWFTEVKEGVARFHRTGSYEPAFVVGCPG